MNVSPVKISPALSAAVLVGYTLSATLPALSIHATNNYVFGIIGFIVSALIVNRWDSYFSSVYNNAMVPILIASAVSLKLITGDTTMTVKGTALTFIAGLFVLLITLKGEGDSPEAEMRRREIRRREKSR